MHGFNVSIQETDLCGFQNSQGYADRVFLKKAKNKNKSLYVCVCVLKMDCSVFQEC